MNELSTPLARRIFLGLFLALLVFGVATVLAPFFVSTIWAGILGYATWPLFLRLEKITGSRKTLAAALMVALVAMALVLPFVWLTGVLRAESTSLINHWSGVLQEGAFKTPVWVLAIPSVGPDIAAYLDRLLGSPTQIKATLLAFLPDFQEHGFALLGGLGRNAARLFFSLFVLFFVFYKGRDFIAQSRYVLVSLIGNRVHSYLDAVGSTTRGVIYGVVLTALVQGALTGLGCWVAGVPAPATLTAITVLIALVPFGTPFVWGTAALWLWVSGETFSAIGLALWGILVISWIDNIIRPMAVSGAAKIPFVLALFGVLGGLSAFGMLGLFLGPIILAVALTVWREWLADPALVNGCA